MMGKRATEGGIIIPDGMILPFNSEGAAPAGWALWNSDSRYPVGAGDTYAVGATGNGSTHALADVNLGTHTMALRRYDKDNGGCRQNAAGAHGHTWTAAEPQPNYFRMPFIQCSGDKTQIPINACMLKAGAGLGEGQTQLNSLINSYVRFSTTIAESNSRTKFVTAGTTGSHNHGTSDGGNNNDSRDSQRVTINHGSHNHTRSVTFNFNMLRLYLAFWYNGGSAFTPTGQMIGLFPSTTPPAGWLFCNGANGTPDMRNHYLAIPTNDSIAGNNYGQATSNLSLTGGTSTALGNHNHVTSKHNGDSNASNYHEEFSGTHTHVVSMATKTAILDYYGIAFMMADV
jgi:hypothetical protein